MFLEKGVIMKVISLKKKISDILLLFKNNRIVIVYVLGNTLNAFLLRMLTTGHVGFRAILFDLSFTMLLTIISFLFNKKRRIKFYYISTFLQMALNIFLCYLFYRQSGGFTPSVAPAAS